MRVVAARRDQRQRPAVEAVLENHEAVALLPPGLELVLARGLERRLHRLGARVAEEHRVGEARRGQALGKPGLLGDPVEVRCVPQALRLPGQRIHQMGMAMARHGDRDAGAEIEESSTVRGVEIGTLAAFERDVQTRIARHDGRNHDCSPILGGRRGPRDAHICLPPAI